MYMTFLQTAALLFFPYIFLNSSPLVVCICILAILHGTNMEMNKARIMTAVVQRFSTVEERWKLGKVSFKHPIYLFLGHTKLITNSSCLISSDFPNGGVDNVSKACDVITCRIGSTGHYAERLHQPSDPFAISKQYPSSKRRGFAQQT